MGIKIYFFGPMDRSGRVRWLLEELGVSYEDHKLDFYNKEHKGEEYLKINPMGAIPAVEIDGEVLIESGALCTYFADKYAEKGLAPGLDSPHRGIYMQWMFFVPATAELPLADGFRSMGLPEEERAKIFAEMAQKFAPILGMLEAALKDGEYLVDNKFSAADIMVGTTLNWARQFQMLQGHPALEAYVDRLKARPAAEKSGAFLTITPS